MFWYKEGVGRLSCITTYFREYAFTPTSRLRLMIDPPPNPIRLPPAKNTTPPRDEIRQPADENPAPRGHVNYNI